MVPPYSNDGSTDSFDPPKTWIEPKPGFVPLLLVTSITAAVRFPYCASMPPRMMSARSQTRG